jgi:hypothetical protein
MFALFIALFYWSSFSYIVVVHRIVIKKPPEEMRLQGVTILAINPLHFVLQKRYSHTLAESQLYKFREQYQ